MVSSLPKLNNFQSKATAEWLLNISQAVVVGIMVGLVIPEIGAKVALRGALLGGLLSLFLYLAVMAVSKKVKDK